MLALTENAVQAIHAIKASSDEIADDAGLRISAQPTETEGGAALQLALVPGPAESDVVLEAEGEQVFLGSEVAGFLDDKVLDARIEEGSVNFAIAPQAGTDSDGPSL